MTQALIITETEIEMKKILDLARKNKFKFRVAKIEANDVMPSVESQPIGDEDWIVPGRPASSLERKKHAEKISRQRGGISYDEFKKEIAAWRKSK